MPLQPSSATLVGQLGAQFDATLEGLVPAGRTVALLDAPDHTNVGDHAILKGQIDSLARLGRTVVHLSSAATGDPERVAGLIRDDTVLCLNGGGNFGDLWPAHQRYREAIVTRFPDHRIVQLPQSLAFEDAASVARARRALEGHPDFTLLVRDQPSLELARSELGCDARLAPDAALAMDPPRRHPPTQAVLCLARQDFEREVDGTDIPGAVDWPRPLDRYERRLLDAGRRLGSPRPIGPARAADAASGFALRRLMQARLDHGIRLLSRGEVVVADRLHAHIMSLLLGIPHVVADTTSGKVHGFIAAWTSGSPLVATAPSLHDAYEAATTGTLRFGEAQQGGA